MANFIKVDLNAKVRVKLSEAGAKINNSLRPSCQIQPDGSIEFKMREMARCFGPKMSMGSPVPFVDNIIFISINGGVVKVNLNASVKVKLTEAGEKIYKSKFFWKQVQPHGYIELQLWELMKYFIGGRYSWQLKPFKNNFIFISVEDDSTVKFVQPEMKNKMVVVVLIGKEDNNVALNRKGQVHYIITQKRATDIPSGLKYNRYEIYYRPIIYCALPKRISWDSIDQCMRKAINPFEQRLLKGIKA